VASLNDYWKQLKLDLLFAPDSSKNRELLSISGGNESNEQNEANDQNSENESEKQPETEEKPVQETETVENCESMW